MARKIKHLTRQNGIILCLVTGRAECTIVDQFDNPVSVDEAKRAWMAGEVRDTNLSFRRLVSLDWDYEALKKFYARRGPETPVPDGTEKGRSA